MFKIIMAAVVASIAITGCSSGSSNVTAAYVPSSKYNDWSCDALNEELSRVQSRAAELTGGLDKEKRKDQLITTAGVVLFWPALFFIEGNDPVKQSQLSTMLGEARAIESARVKSCAR